MNVLIALALFFGTPPHVPSHLTPRLALKTIPPLPATFEVVGASVNSMRAESPTRTEADVALCTLSVADEEPGKILQILSQQTGANLVLMSKVDTKLTIHLKNVPLTEMIRHICAVCELAYLKVGKTYVLASPDRLKSSYPFEWEAAHPTVQPPVVQPTAAVERTTATYQTSFVSSNQLALALDKLFTGKDLSAVPGPTQISPTIGSQDGSKATGTSTAILTKDTAEGSSRLLILSGPKDVVAAALTLAAQLDRARMQVSIAVSIHDISNDAVHDLGVNWDFGNIGFNESQGKGINFGSISRTPISINATLAALDKTSRSKLLASPNVALLDGERAFVLIGDRISYPVLVGYSQNNAPIFSKEEERVGIYLQVSANIGQDGSVTLTLYPQVSSVTGFLTVNGASYPQVSTREAQTTLRVQSGETIVMGGLFQDEDIAAIEKVPFLSKIPLFGEIFTHRKITKNKSQVIITVTPTIVKPVAK